MRHPPFLQKLQGLDPELAKLVTTDRELALKEGAIPAKYKLLMTMLVDCIAAHPDGVARIADVARAAGATEEEIKETLRVAYSFGGTPALVTGLNAFPQQ